MSPQEPEPLPLPAPASSGAQLPRGRLGVQRGPPSPVLGPPGCSSHGKSHRPQLGNPVLSVRCWIPRGGLWIISPPWHVPGVRGQGWAGSQQRGRRAPAPSPSNSPAAQPPFPWGQASPTPPAMPGSWGCRCPPRLPRPRVGHRSAARGVLQPTASPSRSTTRPPIPQAPPAPTAFLPGTPGASPPQEPPGPGEAGPAGGMVTCVPRAIPTPSPSLGRGKAAGKTNLQLQVGKLRHGWAGPRELNRGVGAAAGSWPPTPPPRPAAAPP